MFIQLMIYHTRSLVACLNGVQEAGSSNLLTQTACAALTSISNGSLKFMSAQDFLDHLKYRETNWNILQSLQITNEIQISVLPAYYFRADVNKGYWYVIKKNDNSNVPVYSIDETVDYELIEDSEVITKGGLGRAVVGGALFGIGGAIIGGATGKRTGKTVVDSMKLRITVNNKYNTFIDLDFFQMAKGIKKDSSSYKFSSEKASSIMSLIDYMKSLPQRA